MKAAVLSGACLLLASVAAAQTGQAVDQGSQAVAGDDTARREGALTANDRRYRLEATPVAEPPVIDGRLDEPAWAEAPIVSGFVQSTPDEGQPASERTDVRVLFSDEAIYIAAFCHDREPDGIVATALRRDQRHDDNDSFTVTLDTYHDHRSGYFFETNPLGAKFDAQISGEGGTNLLARMRGDSFNQNWDAVWEASARIVEGGWVVEIAIPLWSLRFEAAETDAWGINFRRSIRRRSEESYWAPVPRQYDATRLSLSGMLTGLDNLASPRNVQVKPFAIGGVSQSATGAVAADGHLVHDRDFLRDGGVDVKWGVTPNLTLDLSGNTDFSQVEADDEQVNLTRFSLFFPEKREFFLENAGLFEFGTGAGLGRGGNSGSVVGFHSRRIGISEANEEIPLYGGARLTGKIGSWSLGALSMQSESTAGLPSTNYSVFRLRRDLASRSNVGVLMTNKQAGGADYNRQIGVDGRWAVNQRTTVDAWWMRTETPGLGGDAWAGQVKFDWGTPLWQFDGSALQIGEDFNPEMGFANRTGIRTYDGTLHWTPYFPEQDWIRNVSPHVSFSYTTDTSSRLLTRFLHADWDLWLPRGDKLSVAHNRRFEHLDLPFEIVPGVVIPPGAYHTDEINLEAVSDPSRIVSASVNYTFGDFWSGERRQWRLGTGFRPGARLSLRVSWNRNDVDLPQGEFTTDLVQSRLALDFSTRLSLAGLVQYNSQIDQVLSNFRLNFIHTPGADLFVVYNERRLAEDSELIDRAVIVKATHLLRF